MFINDSDDDLDFPPCPLCGEDDYEDHLLPCDSCGREFHTYCVDLDEIPLGHWFCESCFIQRAIDNVIPGVRPSRQHFTGERRTRAQRRLRSRNQGPLASVRVGRYENTNRPSESHPALAHRPINEPRDRQSQVMDRRSGTTRVPDLAAIFSDIQTGRERPDPPKTESPEEIRAWNALDKAKEIQSDQATTKRKRSSSITSQNEAHPAPATQRPLKRPMTRRTLDLSGSSSDNPAEASLVRGSAARPSNFRRAEVPLVISSGNGPSFLQSLLKDVESSATPDESKVQMRPSPLPSSDYSSPRVSSPGASPITSNYGSPRALSTTPPPSLSTRPGSPFSLTSKVEPTLPPAEFSSIGSPPGSSIIHRTLPESRQTVNDLRQSRPRHYNSPGSSPPRSEEISPNRNNMSLSAKSNVQKMVSTALEPHYKSNAVSKDQYTDINRSVSRMLYDKVERPENIIGEGREIWERLAIEEVVKAVNSLNSPAT